MNFCEEFAFTTGHFFLFFFQDASESGCVSDCLLCFSLERSVVNGCGEKSADLFIDTGRCHSSGGRSDFFLAIKFYFHSIVINVCIRLQRSLIQIFIFF